MVAFVRNCLVKILILASFCCYDYGANASEAVLKIATDQKVYHKCSLYVIVCWIAKIHQPITMSITVKKVGYWDTSGVANAEFYP